MAFPHIILFLVYRIAFTNDVKRGFLIILTLPAAWVFCRPIFWYRISGILPYDFYIRRLYYKTSRIHVLVPLVFWSTKPCLFCSSSILRGMLRLKFIYYSIIDFFLYSYLVELLTRPWPVLSSQVISLSSNIRYIYQPVVFGSLNNTEHFEMHD